MRISRDQFLENDLLGKIETFSIDTPLMGLDSPMRKETFLKQLVDSVRRIEYVFKILEKNNSPTCIDPHIGGFNPIKAAALHNKIGNHEEACWLVFLITHFGKNKLTGWKLLTDVYTRFGEGTASWKWIQENPQMLEDWIDSNKAALKANGGKFGNHRKYQSLAINHTGKTIRSYVKWIGHAGSHALKFSQLEPNPANSMLRFRAFYNSMNKVHGFGRTGIFDYLTMLGKLGLIDLEPDSVYMKGATGPFTGGQLLFTNSTDATLSGNQLEQLLLKLNDSLNLPFGMQILEDAICNWQKNPDLYKYFSG